MGKDKLIVHRVREVKLPSRGTPQSAGLDFYIPDEGIVVESYFGSEAGKTTSTFAEYSLDPGELIKIPLGLYVEIPKNKALIFFEKSGLAINKGLEVHAPVIDEDHKGEIHAVIRNGDDRCHWIEAGTKIIQGILIDVNYEDIEEETDPTLMWLDKSEARGEGGFGSTGK